MAGAIEVGSRSGAHRRRRVAVRRDAGRRRAELRRAAHTRLPDRPVQARHGAVAPSRRGAQRGGRRRGADRCGMPRGGVGDATGTVSVPGAPTPCQGRKRPAVPAEGDDRGGTQCGDRQARREPVSPLRASVRRRSTPVVVEQSSDRLGPAGSDHGQARIRFRARSAVLCGRAGVGPERLSRPVGIQPGIPGFASSSDERRAGGRFAGHAAEALREPIGSSAGPQGQRDRKQAPCQRRCRRADDLALEAHSRVPASRDRRTQKTDRAGPRTHCRGYALRSELRVGPAGRSGVVIGLRRCSTVGRALQKC